MDYLEKNRCEADFFFVGEGVEKGEKSYKIKFQNGAINRNNAVKAAGAGMVFQFQFGSINRMSQRRLRTSSTCFNSNLVRLIVNSIHATDGYSVFLS